jgi:hypothetical protein
MRFRSTLAAVSPSLVRSDSGHLPTGVVAGYSVAARVVAAARLGQKGGDQFFFLHSSALSTRVGLARTFNYA